MRKLVIAISTLALAASAAFADPIADRQAVMKERGKIVGGLVKMIKGEQEFDAASVQTALQALEANSHKLDIEAMFPAGSDTGGDTTASPKIWEDMNGFKADNEKYVADVKAAAAAPAKDLDALKAQVGTIGNDCGTCHKAFRIKKS
jgi:cytochrome c556